MSTDRHEVNIQGIYIYRHLPHRLGGICVEEYLVFPADLPDLLHWLYNSYLVVYHYNRDHHCFWSDGLFKLFKIHDTIRPHRQVCNFKALIFKMSAAVEDTLVIYLSCDDMLFLRILSVKLRHTL